MNANSTRPHEAQAREPADPYEATQPMPRRAALVTAAVIAVGVSYVFFSDPFGSYMLGDRRTVADLAARPATVAGGERADGKSIFGANCAACHQATGMGVPGVFPPLDGSEWVNADHRIVINILLHGIDGEIKVKDTVYKGTMPSFARLSDAEVAAVATYVRAQWSNHASAVDAGQVAAERQGMIRTAPFASGDELRALVAKP
ncbi:MULTISPECIES: c-type cytochrome [unclassified Cupriavidus]|uniref:c-type cytochrome n=1 Tax=Cupriavidus sp. H19C3 TaxID=3241603 RepID=UPI003BF8812A